MGPEITEAWVHDVAQSQSSASHIEKSPKSKLTLRKEGDSNGGNNSGQSDTSAREDLDEIICVEPKRGREGEFSEDHVSIPGPFATHRAMWVAPRKSTSTPSQSSRSTRSTSPARRAQDLHKLQKPVRFTRQSPRDLAATMSSISKGSCDLFKRISTITKSRKGILPLQLREAVLHELGYGLEDEGYEVEEDVARMFSKRTLTTTPPATCVASNDIKKQKGQRRRQLFVEMHGRVESREDPTAAAENDLRVDETLYKLDLLLELETLLDIVAKTNNFISVSRSEGAWNEAIYSRILELALTDHPEVKVENVTRANIAKPFQPSTRLQLELDLPPATKMIDYAFLLEPEPEDPLSDAILDFVATLQLETFNQSSYEPLRTAPSGVFIKTGIDSKRYPEAQAQLGVWLAAWFERVGKFRSTDDLVIPVLIATAEHWDLWFAIDGRDYFNVYGPLPIGGTDDLESIYLLRYCLSCLGDWMATDFRRWVQLCVGAA